MRFLQPSMNTEWISIVPHGHPTHIYLYKSIVLRDLLTNVQFLRNNLLNMQNFGSSTIADKHLPNVLPTLILRLNGNDITVLRTERNCR
jgi:hypothetical protein